MTIPEISKTKDINKQDIQSINNNISIFVLFKLKNKYSIK